MNKNQVEGRANEAKGQVKEVAGKAEAKYGDVKNDARKATK